MWGSLGLEDPDKISKAPLDANVNNKKSKNQRHSKTSTPSSSSSASTSASSVALMWTAKGNKDRVRQNCLFQIYFLGDQDM